MGKVIVLVKKLNPLNGDLEDDTLVEEWILKTGFCLAMIGLIVCVVFLWFMF